MNDNTLDHDVLAPSPLEMPTLAETEAKGADVPRVVGPPAPLDGRCLTQVERMLDDTELAVSLLEGDAVDAPRVADDDSVARRPELSVVMPVYNERATLGEIVRRVQMVPLEKELLIVDDGSSDGTRELLSELEGHPEIRVFRHARNLGKGAALRTGLAAAQGDIVIVQDADLEYDPEDYPKLLEPIQSGLTDVAYGSRFLGQPNRDASRLHRWGNRVLTAASNLFTRQGLTDMETCYKAFRREVLEGLEVQQNRFGFEPEITAKLSRRGIAIREVPIDYNPRGYAAGKKIGLKDAVNALYCVVRYGLAD